MEDCFGHFSTLNFKICPWLILTPNPTDPATTMQTGQGAERMELLWKHNDIISCSQKAEVRWKTQKNDTFWTPYIQKNKYSCSLLDTFIGPFQMLMEKWGKNPANRWLKISSTNSSREWDHVDLWKPDLQLCQLKIRFLCLGQTGTTKTWEISASVP